MIYHVLFLSFLLLFFFIFPNTADPERKGPGILGGGTVTIPGAVELLQQKTLCIYLQAPLETLEARLAGQKDGRPLAGEGLAERLSAREPLYQKAAHVVLDTDGLTAQEVADEIIIDCL